MERGRDITEETGFAGMPQFWRFLGGLSRVEGRFGGI